MAYRCLQSFGDAFGSQWIQPYSRPSESVHRTVREMSPGSGKLLAIELAPPAMISAIGGVSGTFELGGGGIVSALEGWM